MIGTGTLAGAEGPARARTAQNGKHTLANTRADASTWPIPPQAAVFSHETGRPRGRRWEDPGAASHAAAYLARARQTSALRRTIRWHSVTHPRSKAATGMQSPRQARGPSYQLLEDRHGTEHGRHPSVPPPRRTMVKMT